MRTNARNVYLRMGHHNAEALDPLFGVFAVLGLQDQRLVAGEDFERLRNVARTARHFHRADLVDVDALAAALLRKKMERQHELLH